ncbi:hypothetical protein CDAR_452631 [Caerostris darwini]|uniref:Uncharacterized protein n=1 Tax=Caerostris darwini TaxID=1538125 RepID=A0AAV4SIE4_9ARAC|nr:hypothetical protein CDAR_452631 [Caerostris darwini]
MWRLLFDSSSSNVSMFRVVVTFGRLAKVFGQLFGCLGMSYFNASDSTQELGIFHSSYESHRNTSALKTKRTKILNTYYHFHANCCNPQNGDFLYDCFFLDIPRLKS